MLTILIHDILPIFAMPALGFLLGRLALISLQEAAAVNRVAFLVLQPPLIFPMIAGIDLATFPFATMAVYFACEVAAFVATYALARLVLHRPHAEAWLLGMAVIFVNSFLYILPIAQLIHGEAGAGPVSAVVAVDATIWFSFFIVTTDLSTRGGTGLRQTARRIALNPVLLAILAGLVFALLHLPIPDPALTAMRFAGGGAAPMALFALGVILSSTPLHPDRTVATIAGLKLLAFPALIWLALSRVDAPPEWSALLLLTAAGPSGASPFALALLYRIDTRAIAPVIVWTSLLSLISLAALA